MTQDAGVAVLIVDRNAQFGDDLAHGVDDLIVAFLLDVAVVCVDDRM